MGLQAFTQTKQSKPVSKSSRYKNFTTCIAKSLVQQVGGNWEVVVFEDPTLNAFALPGNKIGVHTGLIKLVDNQDQLAAVIGHEIGHVMAKHSNERLSQQTAADLGLKLASVAVGSSIGQLGMSALGLATEYGVLLPFSRTHESEADLIGLDLMAKAGFNPQQSVVLWKKMSQASSSGQQKTPEFLSTHPADETRITDLSNNLPKALATYKQAQAAGKRPRCRK